MNKSVSVLSAVVFVLSLLCSAKPIQVQLSPSYYVNPLTLNGESLNYGTFSLNSRGVMTVIEGDLVSEKPKPMPFRVHLQRAGVIVRKGASDETREVYSVQLGELLPFAQFGDELVITPVRPTDQWAKRVIRLQSFNWLTLNKTGC